MDIRWPLYTLKNFLQVLGGYEVGYEVGQELHQPMKMDIYIYIYIYSQLIVYQIPVEGLIQDQNACPTLVLTVNLKANIFGS
jgi:hypothetical protein